jgi:tetratricopeptide (TPR) repeat protein
VDGSADSVLQLVDQLSLDLVREIWRSKEPVPSLRVSGLTTGSLAAMREYLTGEQYYRRSAWDSAQAAFARAVEQDSTFALAHYRLAMALGWKGGYGTQRAAAASAAAERYGDRLPPRERALVVAYQLFSKGRLAAADSMRAYVALHPEDADGWYLLGESQYHTKNLTGLDAAALRAPFDRVLALDSTLTPAAIHPLETSLGERDSVSFRRYLDVMKRWADPQETAAYQLAGDMVWRGVLPDSTGGRQLGAHMGVTMATYVAAIKQPNATGDTALAAYRRMVDAVSRSTPDSNQRVQMRAGANLVLLGLGRFKLAEQLNDSLDLLSREQAGGMRLIPHVLGFAPPDYEAEFQAQFLKAPVANPFQAVFLALLLLNSGEGPRASRLIDSLVPDTIKMPGVLRGAVIGARGIRKVQTGDTAGAIADLRYGSERVGNSMVFNGGARLQLGAVLAARPATRDEGLRLLRHAFDSDLGFQPIAAFSLGRAAEAAGQRDLAIEGYSNFLRMWDKADASVQGRVTEAKEALARLTAEGQ